MFSLYQGELFHLSNFIRQFVTLSKKFVQLELFAQTRCLGMLILLITFIRQPVILLGIVFHVKGFHRQAVSTLQRKFIFLVVFQGEREGLTSPAVVLIMVILAFYGCSLLYGILRIWEK